MQTLIVCLVNSTSQQHVAFSSSSQSIHTLLHNLVNLVADHCVEFAGHKCGSNCVEKLIEVSADPAVMIAIAEGFFRRGEAGIIATATNSFGNYVIRHLAQRLTLIVTRREDQSTSSNELNAAEDVAECERKLFRVLSAIPRQSGPYAQGVVAWVNSQSRRLGMT